MNERTDPPPNYGTVGRYTIHDELATGGMATVHLGRLRGAAGFARIVAVKRLRARLAQDRDFVAMFTDEARIASRIRHPSVVSTLDVVADGDELFLVMEYIHGETLAELLRTARKREQLVDPEILASIVLDALRGLHEVHEACDERGQFLNVVHRDISPQNLLVGVDGVTRILDFGIAKAAGQLHTTASGQLKGKLAYMPPEQILGEPLDRRADLYALGVVLWEALTGRRLFSSSDVSDRLVSEEIQPPSSVVEDLPPELDRVVLRATYADKGRRYASAADMARALEACIPTASQARVAAWVRDLAQEKLEERAHLVARIETNADNSTPALSLPRLPIAPPSARQEPLPEDTTRVLTEPQPAPAVTDSAQLAASEIPPTPSPAPRSSAGWLLSLPLAVLGLLVAGWWFSSPARMAPASLGESSPAIASAPPPPSPPTASVPSSPPPAASAEASPPSSAPSSSAPSPGPRNQASIRPTRAPVLPPKASENCTPPYEIRDGIKHYKRACFH